MAGRIHGVGCLVRCSSLCDVMTMKIMIIANPIEGVHTA